MIPLPALWLPILVSAVIVFFATFIIHMVLGYHKSGCNPYCNERFKAEYSAECGIRRNPLS